MINRFQKPNDIDFKVMGLDNHASDFLNWCMQNRDNLEFLKQCKTLEKKAQSSVLHADDMGKIQRVDDTLSHNRK